MSAVHSVQFTYEDSSCFLLARIRNIDGALLTRAVLATINLRVYDSDNPPETEDEDDPAVVAARDLVINTVVFDSLQTDSGWDLEKDPDGFNFKVEVLPTDVPGGSRKYRFEHLFTNAGGSGRQWPVVVEVPTLPLFRS